MKLNKNFKRGRFTLIEVVVVIVILVMLASIATPLYFKHVSKAKRDTARTQLKLLDQALMDYKLDVGHYPETADGLQMLVENVTQEGTAKNCKSLRCNGLRDLEKISQTLLANISTSSKRYIYSSLPFIISGTPPTYEAMQGIPNN